MKKIALLALVLVVLLGSLGVGYAHWRDTVYIDGTVEMGTVNLSFDDVEPPKCDEYYMDGGVLVAGEFLGKEVADCTARYTDSEQDVHSDKWGWQKLVIVVNNAYPSYYAYTTYKLHNIGTIPINIVSFDISGVKQDSSGAKIHDLLYVAHDPAVDPYVGGLYEDTDGNGQIDAGEPEVINITVVNGLPFQIDPCNTNKGEIDLHFKQEAQQCHTYLITVVITAQQWNLD